MYKGVAAVSKPILPPLWLERYYARWEVEADLNLSASDPEPLALQGLLVDADPETPDLWDGPRLGYLPSPDTHSCARLSLRPTSTLMPRTWLSTGAQEAIYLLTRIPAAPGVHATVISPAYQVLQEALRVAGAAVSLVPLDAEAGWTLDIGTVVRSFRDDTRLLVLNFPHNPTGSHGEVQEYRQLLGEC